MIAASVPYQCNTTLHRLNQRKKDGVLYEGEKVRGGGHLSLKSVFYADGLV